jgi:hypothetical protein
MHRGKHPLLERARRIAAELEWERTACDVCSSRGVLGTSGRATARADGPEPCPACLGVSYVWITPNGILDVEEVLEEYERSGGADLDGCARD